MNWSFGKFALAVVATSVVLVGAGAVLAANAFASAVPFASAAPRMIFAQHAGGLDKGSWTLPPELAGLKDIPADQRFGHFKGVQVNLTDKDGKPVAVSIVPGVATAVSASSLTLSANDGSTHSFTLNAQTMTGGKAVASGQNVVVVTLNGSPQATAVVTATPGDWPHR